MSRTITLVILFLLISACATYKGTIEIRETKEINYADYPEERGRGELKIPARHNGHLIVLVHGGGWSSGDFSQMRNIAQSLSSNGYITFNMNYRLAPTHKHPAPAEDLGKALVFIKDHLAQKNIKLKKIGLWGYSAGAHIVSYYALKYGPENKLPRADIVVAGGSPMDLTWYPLSPYIKGYYGYYRDKNLAAYTEGSPSEYVNKNAPPFFLYHAIEDRLVEHAQSAKFEALLKQSGVPVKRHDIKWWGHTTAFLFSSEAIKEGVLYLNESLN